MSLEGGCHCGAVRFRIADEPPLDLLNCNCSVCTKTGFLHLIATAEQFELLTGEGELTDYRFGTGTARHLFCSTCGVKSFYVPRSHPDGYSVNARCLDGWPDIEHTAQPYDGRNWEQARADLG